MDEYSHAKKWLELANKEEDSFDKFVYSFFAFNALYSPYYETSERQAIGNLFNKYYNKNRMFQDLVQEICEMDEFYYFADRAPIKNCRYNSEKNSKDDPDTTKYHAALLSDSVYKCNNAMLMIIYQIRCNLFHGNKQYDNRNDFEIMKNAAVLLFKYVEAFVKCYGHYYFG